MALVGVAVTALPAVEVNAIVESGWERVDTTFPAILVAPLFPLLALAQPRLHRLLVVAEVVGVGLAVYLTFFCLDFELFFEVRRLAGYWLILASQFMGVGVGAALAWRPASSRR